jgi:tetratricopeptide (TPR) repeat protein
MSSERLCAAGLGAVLLVTALCMFRVVGFGFVNWDDPQQVYRNPLVLSTPGPSNTLDIFSETVTSHYQPLTTLLLNLESWASGTDPAAFHAVSLLLHLLNVVLVYLLIRRLFSSPPVALIVAAFFALHPLRVESVAWATEQKGLLSSMFLLASFLVYAGGKWSPQRREPHRWILSLTLFIMAMLCKATAVVLPLLLLTYDLLLQRSKADRRLLLRLLPFLLVGMGLLAPTLAAHRSGEYLPLEGLGLWERAVLVVRNVAFYPKMLLAPMDIAPVYPVPQDLMSPTSVVVIVLLAAATALLLASKRLRRDQMLAFGLIFYLLSIAPVLQIVPFGRAPMANRFSYLPSVGLLLALTALGRYLWRAARPLRLLTLLLLPGLLAGACLLTAGRLDAWRDSETLWSEVLIEHPELSYAYYNLGHHYLSEGNPQRALDCYTRAIELDSGVSAYYINRGNLFLNVGETEGAARDYATAVRLDPANAAAHFNLGNALRRMGRLEAAADVYGNALELNPQMATAWLNLGSCEAELGNSGRAMECYETALRLDPGLDAARRNLERLLSSPDTL